MEVFILIIVILLFFYLAVNKAKIKGEIGEKTVSSLLYFLDSSKYYTMNNVVIKTEEITSQIDHVVVSDFGVFVIETKNYKGWIVGGEKSEYWTQVIFQHKNKFYNPLLQNSGHIRALKNSLKEYRYINYHSIVAFSNDAEIKISTSKDVINISQLSKTIYKYSHVNLTESEKQEIIQKIKSLNVADSYNKQQHVKSINQRIIHRENAIAENKCPRCGSRLSKRKGKFGIFLGCNSYPKCKFTKNI